MNFIKWCLILKDIVRPNQLMFSVKDIVLKSLLSAKTDLQKEYEEVGPTLFQDIFVSTVI